MSLRPYGARNSTLIFSKKSLRKFPTLGEIAGTCGKQLLPSTVGFAKPRAGSGFGSKGASVNVVVFCGATKKVVPGAKVSLLLATYGQFLLSLSQSFRQHEHSH